MPDPRAAAKNRPPAGASIREEDEYQDDGHITSDDDDSGDHHEHDDVSVDGVLHGQPQRRVVLDSVGLSPVTPPPRPRLNPATPTPVSTTPPPPAPESQMATWDYFFGPTPTPPPTLEQPAGETWMGRREKEPMAEVRPPVTKPVVSEPSAAEGKPPKAPGPPLILHYHTSSMGAVETWKGKMVASGTVSLLSIVSQLDNHFLKASESAHDVSKKLEATRMHYHSNHADSRGKYCYQLVSNSILCDAA
jgi:hypothetical protein